MNNISTGKKGEEIACNYLIKNGYKILDTNYSCRFGEIDIIARRGEYICFVEVKTRSANAVERPVTAVDGNKQRRILTTAQHYLMAHPSGLQPRFDIAEVITESGRVIEFNYIENAFGE